jgi:hypothetical protein
MVTYLTYLYRTSIPLQFRPPILLTKSKNAVPLWFKHILSNWSPDVILKKRFLSFFNFSFLFKNDTKTSLGVGHYIPSLEASHISFLLYKLSKYHLQMLYQLHAPWFVLSNQVFNRIVLAQKLGTILFFSNH